MRNSSVPCANLASWTKGEPERHGYPVRQVTQADGEACSTLISFALSHIWRLSWTEL